MKFPKIKSTEKAKSLNDLYAEELRIVSSLLKPVLAPGTYVTKDSDTLYDFTIKGDVDCRKINSLKLPDIKLVIEGNLLFDNPHSPSIIEVKRRVAYITGKELRLSPFDTRNTLQSVGEYVDVGGHLDFSSKNQLPSLGTPQSVGGHLDFSSKNQLPSLGTPQSVDGHLDCSSKNQLTSLGTPQSVGGHLDFSSKNQLTSLGTPQSVDGHLDCSSKDQLTRLEPQEFLGL